MGCLIMLCCARSELLGYPSDARLLIINTDEVRHTDLEFLSSSKAREAVRREAIMIIDYPRSRTRVAQWPDDQAGLRPPRRRASPDLPTAG